MSIENNLKRIADALELIAENLTADKQPEAPAPAQVAPAPEIPGSAVEAAAPAVTTAIPTPPPAAETPAAPVAPAPAPAQTAAAPAVNVAPQLTVEQLNEALVTEFERLGNNREPIDQVLQQHGATSISTLDPTQYSAVLTAVQALPVLQS